MKWVIIKGVRYPISVVSAFAAYYGDNPFLKIRIRNKYHIIYFDNMDYLNIQIRYLINNYPDFVLLRPDNRSGQYDCRSGALLRQDNGCLPVPHPEDGFTHGAPGLGQMESRHRVPDGLPYLLYGRCQLHFRLYG